MLYFTGMLFQFGFYSSLLLIFFVHGLVYSLLLLRKGKDGSVWMNRLYDWFINLFNPDKKSKTSVKEKVFYNTGNRTPYSKQAIVTQQRVDEILDKINQKGFEFLTEEEKKILKKASEEDL